jgi:hypothetical protein
MGQLGSENLETLVNFYETTAQHPRRQSFSKLLPPQPEISQEFLHSHLPDYSWAEVIF